MENVNSYEEFLKRKRIKAETSGVEVAPDLVHPLLYPFQRDLTLWALRKGRDARQFGGVRGTGQQGFRMEIQTDAELTEAHQYAATKLIKAFTLPMSGNPVRFSVSAKTAKLTIKIGTATVTTTSKTGLANLPPDSAKPGAIVSKEALSAALRFTDFAAARAVKLKPQWAMLAGASLHFRQDRLNVERSDGVKYAFAPVPADVPAADWETIISQDAVRLLGLVTSEDGMLSVGLTDNKFWVRGDLLVWSGVYASEFPDVMSWVNLPEDPILAIEATDYVSQILAALDGVDEDKNIVRISGFEGETLLLASEGEVLSVSATAQASVFRDMDISLNAGYLATAMRKMRPPVYFYRAEPNAPVFLKEKGADRLIMLLPFAVREKKKKKETDF